jgi:hypothetical protein
MLPLRFEKVWPLAQLLEFSKRGNASFSMHSRVRQLFGSARHSEVKNKVSFPRIFDARQYCEPESHSSALQINFTDGPEKLVESSLVPGAGLDFGARAAAGVSFLSRPQLDVTSREAITVMKRNGRNMCRAPMVWNTRRLNTVT